MEAVEKRFSILCDIDGRIDQVIHDDEHVLPESIVGNMIFSAVVPGDLVKIFNFFLELKKKRTAIGWEINLTTQSGPETFSFFGGIFDDRIGIAASTVKNGAQMLFAELTKINNEQTNMIRSLAKENAKHQVYSNDPPVSYYDELSRLNNELVNMQRELAKKNGELDELNKLKNQFLGIASHDLRNPIGVILGYSEIILADRDNISNDELYEWIDLIHKTGNFMLGMVNNLLDISNIESGQLDLNLSEQNLGLVIRETIRVNEIFARAKSMEIIFNEPVEKATTLIDRPKIEQVITNLLSNAMKYSFQGTKITVSLEIRPESAKISVQDQGQGIREEELGKLFKPFQKTSTRTTAGEKSTGLGLSIVKKIVEAHHGNIFVNSKFGEGSVFFFTLPVKGN